MKGLYLLGLAVVVALALSGCQTPMLSAGVFNGNSDDPMVKIKITKSDWDPRTGENPLLYTQYLAVQDVADRLQIQIDWQTSSNREACASEGIPYAGAGAVGGGSQTVFYPGVAAGPAAGVTGVTYGLGGCVNGMVTHSYDGDASVGDSLERAIRDIEEDGKEYKDANGNSLFHNVHVTASYVRSRNNRNSPAPGLAEHMPDWHGPAVGK
ncbi:hypothetical protein HY091_02675 [Candidatus Kaiserbacteria bacterium]|nr:hypothetical protein [Candidatus Kaiserbacteria bacterium]